jgi:hypothetical protein
MTALPAILIVTEIEALQDLADEERCYLSTASRLLSDGYCDHALLDIWNASVSNLRRRVEEYGVDIFVSAVKDEAGRKRYQKDGDVLSERWGGVDDLVLIEGSTRLGILNKKASKALEMINWMRNHASAAHPDNGRVERSDVVALAMLLYTNLFSIPLPEKAHSVSGLFDPVKCGPLTGVAEEMLADQISTLRTPDVRIAFGFLLDQICAGEEPSSTNSRKLFPVVWRRAGEDSRKVAGLRLYSLEANPSSDESKDKRANVRLLDALVEVSGIEYVPVATRAQLYRRAARALAKAKNTSYGWSDELVAARTMAQFGPHVPSIAFEEVYQEILVAIFGNYWGRSEAHKHLAPFIDVLGTSEILLLVKMIKSNERVRSELSQEKPRIQAERLLEMLKSKLTIDAHRTEVDRQIQSLLKEDEF